MDEKVLIIGGGVIGLAIARELHKKGLRNIKILERGEIGKEASFAAAGMLAPQAETNEPDDFFHLCNDSNKLYPKFAKELLEETGVDIELDQNGTLYLAFDEIDVAKVRRRFEWQSKAGLEVEHLPAQEVRRIEPFVSPDVREGLFFPNDWQIENRKLLEALKEYVTINGIEVLENTEITNLLIESEKVSGVETSERKFSAQKVIIATGAWTSLIKTDEPFSILPMIKPIRGQMISFHTAKRLFTNVIYSPRGYIVPRKSGKILAGATVEDVGFDKKVTETGIQTVYENALEISPSLSGLPIDDKWAGLRPISSDGLPILGEVPNIENLFIATAHYRNGILLAPITAKIIADKIAENRVSKYLDIFGFQRFQAVEKLIARS